MQTNGHNAHHTPNETAALLPSRTSSSSSSSGNDLRESLMASTDSHEPALGTKPAAPSSASPQPTAFTHFPHQQSISKDAYDLSKIRGQGWIGQVLPGPACGHFHPHHHPPASCCAHRLLLRSPCVLC